MVCLHSDILRNQKYSDSNDSTPLTGWSQSFRVSDESHQIFDDRRTWQVFCGVKCHIIYWLWTGTKGPWQVLQIYGDILVCIFCLDPQMACFLPISSGVCRSKPRWIHQHLEDKVCSSLSALTNKQQLTRLYSKRMQKAKGISQFWRTEMDGNGCTRVPMRVHVFHIWNVLCNLGSQLQKNN